MDEEDTQKSPEAADDEQIGRFCDAFVSDFDGTSALIISALDKDSESPTAIVETLTEILRQVETWLPTDTCERFESELIPHVTQTVLAKSEDATMDAESVECIADFLESVLERVAQRLLNCDPCLLPTLVRILDEHRSFYENRFGSSNDENETFVNCDDDHESTLYLRIISHWGAIDGFTIFLRCLQASGARRVSDDDGNKREENQPELQEDSIAETVFSFDAIQCVFRAIYAIKNHLATEFLKQYVGPLAQSSRVYIASMTEAEFASIPRDKLLEIVHIVDIIVAQASSTDSQDQSQLAVEDAELCVQLLNLDLMLRYFTSSSLEKRIYGLVEMIDVLNKASASYVEYFMKWINDNHLLDLLFGEKKHPELIKRSVPLVRFVLSSLDFPSDWIDAIWVCFAGKKMLTTEGSSGLPAVQSTGSQTHEIVRVTVHALLIEVIGFARRELLDYLMTAIKDSSRQLDTDILTLLSTMTKPAASLRKPVLMYLWEALPSAPSAITDSTIEEIVDLLGGAVDGDESAEGCLVDEFVRLCAESIECAGSQLSVSLRLIEKIGGLVKDRSIRVDSSIAVRLIPAVLAEMEIFELQFKQVCDDVDYSAADADDHVRGVRERLLALRGCILIAWSSSGNVAILDVINSVWDICVYKTCGGEESSSLFFQWIEYCFRTKRNTVLGDKCDRLLDEYVAQTLIESKFARLEGETMTMSALACFHHLFRKVNIFLGGIVVCDREGAEVDEDELDDAESQILSDLLTGKPVTGIEELWSFALHAADQNVAEEAMTLLARYHMDVVATLVNSVFLYDKKREFIAKCTRYLCRLDSNEDPTCRSSTDPEARPSRLVDRCLDCLRFFLDANQVNPKNIEGGTGSIDNKDLTEGPESQRLSSFALENLEQKLQLLDIYPSPMKESPYPSASNSEAGTPTMLFAGPRRPSWNFKQHHAVLEAIQDECDNDIRPLEQYPAEEDGGPILGKGGMRRGEILLDLPTTERRLSIDTSVPGALRPTQLTASPSVQARPNLQWFQTLHASSSQEPDFVIDDFRTEPEQDVDAIKSPLAVAQLLVNWPQLFDTLFDLVLWDNATTSQRAWSLLCQLPINLGILKRMMKLRPASNEDVVWSQLLDGDSPHRLLYALRLVEALLVRYEQGGTESKSEDNVRRQWRERFLRLGGAQHIKGLLAEYHSRIDKSSIVMSCIGALARILAYVARLHLSPSNLISVKSPYDSRLCHATLPQAFPLCGDQIQTLFTLVVELLCPKSPRTSAYNEGTTLSLMDLFCSIIPLNPTVAMSVLQGQLPSGIREVLGTVFSALGSCIVRDKAIDLIVGMEGKFSTPRASNEIYEGVLKSSFDMCCDGEGSSELLELVVRLSPHLAAISSWIVERSVVPILLSGLELLVDIEGTTSKKSVISQLRVVATIASVDEQLRDACLAFKPGTYDDDEMPWILHILVRRILWNTNEKVPREKCHDSEIRKAAQDVVVALVFNPDTKSSRHAPVVLRQLGSFYRAIESRLVKMGRPWSVQPSEELQDLDENGIRFAGLVNPGCVCYMNSLMQQLFMMPAFRKGLLTMDTSTTGNEWRHEVAELQKLFVGLSSSFRKALDPTEFALSHRDMDGNPTDLNTQMDADEFFCLLLDRLETCLLKSSSVNSKTNGTATTFLNQCFGGVLVNQILTEHGHLSEREEKFFALSLDISQKQHLPESLSLYVKGETLDGDNAYFCEKEQKKVSATKRVCIKKLPNTLVCHLKRFEFDFDTMQKIKIHDYMAFPEELDMFPYTSEAFATNRNDETQATAIMYDLSGIVVHSGSSEMGHYYSFIKDRAPKSDGTSSWFEFNDQTVRPFDLSTMGDECFGGEEVTQKWEHGSRTYVPVVQRKRRSAYMLVYDRREPVEEANELESSTVIDWLTTPLTVQEQRDNILRENQELLHFVNAAAPEHAHFLQKIAEIGLHSEVDNSPEDNDEIPEFTTSKVIGGADDYARELLRLPDIDVYTAFLSCQHILGVSSLLQTDDDSTIGLLLRHVEDWFKSATKVASGRKLLFCKWLLSKAVSRVAIGGSKRTVMRRSWLFDVLVFCEKRPLFVQACLSLLRHAWYFLVTHGLTEHDKQPAIEFVRYVAELFYERHDVAIEDPTSGTRFPVPSASVIHAVTILGVFLNDCLGGDQESDTVKKLFLNKSGFVDRFLFSLQESEPSRRSETSSVAPLTSRERFCSFSLERQLLSDMLTALDETVPGTPIDDPRVLLNQSVLKNMVAFEFAQVLTPLLVHCARHQLSGAQGEKLVTLLLAVLEEVKSSHLDQLLHLFGALLDAEDEADGSGGLAGMHEHIFCPSSGLLEAAAYYRDHRTLHEYAFLLLEFVVTRASLSPRLQRYFQTDQEIVSQVEWIKHWLGSYLDPSGTIRRCLRADENSDGHSTSQETADRQEGPTLEQEVRLIFGKAERAFGFAMLQTQSSDDDEEFMQTDNAFAIESLENSDGLLFSSDGENQDEEEDTSAVERSSSKGALAVKRVIHMERRPSFDTKTSRIDPKTERSRPEIDEDASTSSTIITRAHMSSAA